MNGILETVETQVKQEFTTGIVGAVDAAAGPLDDVLAMWSIRAARDAALLDTCGIAGRISVIFLKSCETISWRRWTILLVSRGAGFSPMSQPVAVFDPGWLVN